jgi:hypothetical protein
MRSRSLKFSGKFGGGALSRMRAYPRATRTCLTRLHAHAGQRSTRIVRGAVRVSEAHALGVMPAPGSAKCGPLILNQRNLHRNIVKI